jgi:hypothetical protein
MEAKSITMHAVKEEQLLNRSAIDGSVGYREPQRNIILPLDNPSSIESHLLSILMFAEFGLRSNS